MSVRDHHFAFGSSKVDAAPAARKLNGMPNAPERQGGRYAPERAVLGATDSVVLAEAVGTAREYHIW